MVDIPPRAERDDAGIFDRAKLFITVAAKDETTLKNRKQIRF